MQTCLQSGQQTNVKRSVPTQGIWCTKVLHAIKRIASSPGNLLKKARVECSTECCIAFTTCRVKFNSRQNYSRLLWDKCQVPTLRYMMHKCAPYCEASCLNPGCYIDQNDQNHSDQNLQLIQLMIKNGQHSIKSGILYSSNLSQRARRGIVNSGTEVDKENISGIQEYISTHIKDE